MIRLLVVLLMFIIVGFGLYGLLRLHSYLIVRWKNIIETYELYEQCPWDNGDAALRGFIMLCGLTVIPVIIDLSLFAVLYSIIKDLLT